MVLMVTYTGGNRQSPQDTRKATEKQFNFLLTLVNERGPEAKIYVDTQLTAWKVQHPRELTASAMSSVIGVVKDMPKPKASTNATSTPVQSEPEAGIYRSNEDGTLLRVYKGQQSGKMLAKEIGRHSDGTVGYEYLGMASRFLNEHFVRLTLAEVGALGKAWDHCLICGARLDNPESVDRGVGPVCAARYGIADKAIELPKPATTTVSVEYQPCTEGQACDANSMCTKHNSAYQNRYGRAYNE